jgi:hypothetical protein
LPTTEQTDPLFALISTPPSFLLASPEGNDSEEDSIEAFKQEMRNYIARFKRTLVMIRSDHELHKLPHADYEWLFQFFPWEAYPEILVVFTSFRDSFLFVKTKLADFRKVSIITARRPAVKHP